MQLSGYLTLCGSLLAAIILTILPLPTWLIDIWPLWLLTTLAYWVIALPHRIGLWSAFVSGLLLDVLNNSLFGEHALALLVVIYCLIRLHRQIRFFPNWQQSIVIMFFALIYQLVLYIIQTIIHSPMPGLDFILPILTTGLFWPLVYGILRYYRQKYRIT